MLPEAFIVLLGEYLIYFGSDRQNFAHHWLLSSHIVFVWGKDLYKLVVIDKNNTICILFCQVKP